MKRILWKIPPLPASMLPILLVVIGLVAVGVILNSSRAARKGGTSPDFGTPLIAAAGTGFALWLWSRHAITLYSYGFFLILGFFAATSVAALEAKRRGFDPNRILDLALPMLVVTVVMCRVLYVILDWKQFTSPAQMLQVWSGGLSFHGALIGAFMVLAYFAWKWKVPMTTLGDIVAPSVFLGYAFGRVGCFFNGCCYGAVCSPSLPWATRFPDEHHPGFLTPPSHPAQLYSALLALLLFFVMQRAKKLPAFNRFPGQMMLLFLGLYAIERAIVEIFRNGATATTVLGTNWLTDAQLVSIIGLVVIAVVWGYLWKRARTSTPNSEPQTLNVPLSRTG